MNMVYLSSFTCSFNPRNDGVSVFSVTYSKRLVHNWSNTWNFTIPRLYIIAHSQSTKSDEIPESYLRRNEHVILAMMLSV